MSMTPTCMSLIVIIIIISTLSFGLPLTPVTHSFRHFVTKKIKQLKKYEKEQKEIDKVQIRKLLFTSEETTEVFSNRDIFI